MHITAARIPAWIDDDAAEENLPRTSIMEMRVDV